MKRTMKMSARLLSAVLAVAMLMTVAPMMLVSAGGNEVASADFSNAVGAETVYAATVDADGIPVSEDPIQIGNTDFYLQPPTGGQTVFGSGADGKAQIVDGALRLMDGVAGSFGTYADRECKIVWKPANFNALTNSYVLSVEVYTNSSATAGHGFRFNVNADGTEYYSFEVGRGFDYGEPGWTLKKVTAETSTVLLTSTRLPEAKSEKPGYIKGYSVDITVNAADTTKTDLTVSIKGTTTKGENITEKATYTDNAPFTHNANAGYINFAHVGGEGRSTDLTSVALKNYTPAVEGEGVDDVTPGLVAQTDFSGLTEDATIYEIETDGDNYPLSETPVQIGTTDFYVNPPADGAATIGAKERAQIGNGVLKLQYGVGGEFAKYENRECKITWQPAGYENLKDSYKLTVSATSGNSNAGHGFRFNVNETGDCYYALIIGCAGYGEPAWKLVKSYYGEKTDILTSTKLPQSDRGNFDGALGYVGTYQVAITVDRVSTELTTVTVDYAGTTGRKVDASELVTYEDTNPFDYAPADTPIHFIPIGGGNGETYLNSVKLENYAPPKSETEAAEAVYADITGPVEDGVMMLTKENLVHKYVNNGAEAVTISGSHNGSTWTKIATLNAGESKYDTIADAAPYGYLKLEGSQDVSVYTEIENIKLNAGGYGYQLLLSANGADAKAASITSSNEAAVKVVGTTIVPVGAGEATLTISGGTATATKTVIVTDSTDYAMDFTQLTALKDGSASGSVSESSPVLAIADGWNLVHGTNTYSSYPTISFNNGLYMTRLSEKGFTTSDRAQVVFDQIPSDLTGGFEIRTTFLKSSITAGITLDFMRSEDGKSFYQLQIAGNAGEINEPWVFRKVVNNAVVDTVYGPEAYLKVSDSPDGITSNWHGWFGNASSIEVTIRVQDNLVTWEIDATRHKDVASTMKKEKFVGVYADKDPLTTNASVSFVNITSTDSAKLTVPEFYVGDIYAADQMGDGFVKVIEDTYYYEGVTGEGTIVMLAGYKDGMLANVATATAGADGKVALSLAKVDGVDYKVYVWDAATQAAKGEAEDVLL